MLRGFWPDYCLFTSWNESIFQFFEKFIWFW